MNKFSKGQEVKLADGRDGWFVSNSRGRDGYCFVQVRALGLKFEHVPTSEIKAAQ